MTPEEIVALATALRPNELGTEVLTALLYDLEERLAAEVRGEQPRPRAVTRATLSVPAPFDRVYWTYLMAMIDLAAGNAQAYANSDALYRESLEAYARWHQRKCGSGC